MEAPIELPGAMAAIPGQREAYHASVKGRDLVFVPYYAVETERYNTYFRTA